SRRPVPRLPGHLPLGRSQGTRRPLHPARRKLPSTWLARVGESAWAQRSTVAHGEGAAHRIHAGFRGDLRRGNTCFPQRDSVGQPLGTVFKNPLTVEDGKVDFSRTLTYPSACSKNKCIWLAIGEYGNGAHHCPPR